MDPITISIAAGDGGRFSAYMATPQCGSGPGTVIAHDVHGVDSHIRGICDLYAQEGYVAIAPDLFWRVEPGSECGYDASGSARGREIAARCDAGAAAGDLASALDALRVLPQLKGKVGAIGFGFGAKIAWMAAARGGIEAAICYGADSIEKHRANSIACPIMFHWGANDAEISAATREAIRAAMAHHDHAEFYVYADAGRDFACDRAPGYHRFSARLAHSRTIGLLRWTLGPRYDLGALWEQHAACEFAQHDVDATMRTMVPEPYVNHIPTLTGGVGYKDLYRFYKNHFIPRLPPDARLVPVTRTIGPDRLIDEFLLCFTHDREIDFIAPGVPATGKYVEVPHVAVVEFRGDKIAHEHIHWDHASLLKQLGVLDTRGLPVAGIEGAKKLVDERLPANELMPQWKRSE